MSRSPHQPSEQKVPTAPRSGLPPVEAANTPGQESEPSPRIPFKWRVVFAVWLVSFVILIIYEVMLNFTGLIYSTSK
jgi:hypothetical protein